jgi:hypothetical protein
MAQIAVDAVLAVADLERKDVNFDLIKVEGMYKCLLLAIVREMAIFTHEMQISCNVSNHRAVEVAS